MPAKNLRFERFKQKEDMLRRKQSQRELRKLQSIRGYWTKESNIRHQNLIENPIKVLSDKPNLKKYELKNKFSKSIENFIKSNRNRVLNILEINTKIQFNLEISVEKEDNDGIKNATWYLIKPYAPTLKPKEIRKLYNSLVEFLNMKLVEMEYRESGWRLKSIDKLIISVVPYTHESGACFENENLPKKLQNREIFPILKNDDKKCFKWAVVYSLFGGNNGKITKDHQKKSEQFNWQNITYPADMSDMEKFEKNNPEYLIYCFGYISNKFYIHYSNKDYRNLEKKGKKTIHLLLYNNHYFPIMNLRSFNVLLYGSKDLYFSCKTCLCNFSSQEKLDEHYVYCCEKYKTKVKMPKEGNIFFKNFKNSLKVPYLCYWDSESMLEPINIKKRKTTQYQKHKSSRFGLVFVDCIKKEKEYFSFSNAKDFVNKILELAKLYETNIPLKGEEEKKGREKLKITQHCEKCKIKLDGKGVMDHCHFSGKFRQILCNKCNLGLKTPKFMPVICHNFCGYDEKTIIRELNFLGVDVIAKNIENFITITLLKHNIRFIDSYKFLASSLDTLTQNLLDKGKENFFYTNKEFGDNIDLCLKKGVFPYSYFNSEKVLKETSLPPKEKFYNDLTGEHISDENYKHAQKVWKVFECKTFEDYLNLYLKLDCFQICDVFEQFREKIMEVYDLDPAHYLTIPSMAFDCLLKYSGVKLEIITDPTMYNFLEKAKKGGVSMSVKRFATSNNKYQEDYDPNKESSYIPYFDANGLYSEAMCKKLPVSDFKWGDPEKWEEYEHCFVDVDVFLPSELWDYFSDYPLFPTHEFGKLVCTFSPKENYVCTKEYLQDCINRGYKIKKVNKVLTYKAETWIKSYIEKNTELRTKAKSKFEKDLWKLMNNIVYGKQIENVRNRVNIKFCSNSNVKKEYRKQTFKGVMELSEKIWLIEHLKEEVYLNKPIYGGVAILDYSKITMNKFFYDYLKPKFGKNVELLYTDTDSFILHIFCEDLYKEISEDVDQWFDTSAYGKKFKCLDGSDFPIGKNKKVPGKFKDECGDSQIKTHIGLRAKVYINEKENKKEEKRCKGITKKIMKNININDYFLALKEGKIKYGEMNIIRSHNHTLYTEKIEKKVLDPHDEKRRILEDGIHTIPWF